MKELLAVSDSNVTSFRIDDHAVSSQVADVVIGTCVTRSAYPSGGVGGGWNEGNDVVGDYRSSNGGGMCE